MDTRNGPPPPLFTKRERYALALLTMSFIVTSALVHVLIGSVGSSLFPHVRPEAAAPLRPLIIDHYNPATPTPTPAPTPRVIATAIPHEQQTRTPQAHPPVRPPRPDSIDHKPRHPTHTDDVLPTGPPIVTPSTAVPSTAPTAHPIAPTADQIVDTDFIRKVTPDYPEIAKDENVEGTVTVRVTIGPDGQVDSAVVVQSSGNAQLDDAALKAARASLYRAPMLDGKPTTRDYLIVYTFSLET